ncbi:MAG: hypothetical protein RIQ89_2347 [Bacteroidota bacterium]
MKKLLLTAAILLHVALINAQSIITVSGDITSNTFWSNNNQYILSGFVYVTANAELTIEPGTIIKGEKASKGSLVICRGSKLFAQGTASLPIIFTSNEPIGTRTYGDWGGLIILGQAPVNDPAGEKVIEGGLDPVKGLYGGTNAADNSGILQFIRIEFPGIAFQPNNEINGLTLGGVGNGTQIDHVQVSYSGDDAFECFGGTVNCKNLIAYRSLDDDFDTDFGYNGNMQFLIAFRDSNVADVSGSNSFESDNDATGSMNLPYTAATYSNVTVIGPYQTANTSVNSNYKRGAHIRRASRSAIFNSVISGYPKGLLIDGAACETNASNNDLEIKNSVLAGNIDNFAVASGSIWDISAWYNTSSYGNSVLPLLSDCQFSDITSYSNPNCMPLITSPLLNGASFVSPRINNPFFEVVSFKGAIGNIDWTSNWTNYAPENSNYILSNNDLAGNNSIQVFPNPFNEQLIIKGLIDSKNLILQIIDVSGKIVLQKNMNNVNSQQIIQTSNLSSGIYTLSLIGNDVNTKIKVVK